jgi:hypothetical protein
VRLYKNSDPLPRPPASPVPQTSSTTVTGTNCAHSRQKPLNGSAPEPYRQAERSIEQCPHSMPKSNHVLS